MTDLVVIKAGGEQGPQGIQGLPGADGIDGDDGIFAEIASQGEAVLGTNSAKGMTPERGRDQIEGLAFTVPNSILAQSAGFPGPATLRRRWLGTGLDVVADLKAVGDGTGSGDTADNAAMQEFVAETVNRGCELRIPMLASGLRLSTKVAFNTHRNIRIKGIGGGSASKPGAYIVNIGASTLFEYSSCLFCTMEDVAVINNFAGADQLLLVKANAAPALSSIGLTFRSVNWASVAGLEPSCHMWLRNCQQIKFDHNAFSQCDMAAILGDIANVDSGIASGGCGRIEFEHSTITGDIQFRLCQAIRFSRSVLSENWAAGLANRGVELRDGGVGSVIESLVMDDNELVGLWNGADPSDQTLLQFIRTYTGLRATNNRISNYKIGFALFGTSGSQGHVHIAQNDCDMQHSTSDPRIVDVASTFGGTLSGIGTNFLSAAAIADGGQECEDDRSDVVLVGKIKAVKILAADQLITVHATNWTDIITTTADYYDGSLYSIVVPFTVALADANTVILRVLFDGVELAEARAQVDGAANDIVNGVISIRRKLGPGSAKTLKVQAIQTAGSASTVRACDTSSHGATKIIIERIDR